MLPEQGNWESLSGAQQRNTGLNIGVKASNIIHGWKLRRNSSYGLWTYTQTILCTNNEISIHYLNSGTG